MKAFTWSLQRPVNELPIQPTKLRHRFWVLLRFDFDGTLSVFGVREPGFVHGISSVGEQPHRIVLASSYALASLGVEIPVARNNPVAVGFDAWSPGRWIEGGFVLGPPTRVCGGRFDFEGCSVLAVSPKVVTNCWGDVVPWGA